MSEWKSLKTFADWANKLDEILDSSHQTKTSAERIAAQQRLRDFRRESPLLAAELDDIAMNAISDLTAAQLGESVLAISQRSAELDGLTKHLAHVTSGASKAASWINLESPVEIAKSLTEVASQFVALKKKLEEDGVDADLVQKVEDTRAAIANLRDLIESKL